MGKAKDRCIFKNCPLLATIICECKQEQNLCKSHYDTWHKKQPGKHKEITIESLKAEKRNKIRESFKKLEEQEKIILTRQQQRIKDINSEVSHLFSLIQQNKMELKSLKSQFEFGEKMNKKIEELGKFEKFVIREDKVSSFSTNDYSISSEIKSEKSLPPNSFFISEHEFLEFQDYKLEKEVKKFKLDQELDSISKDSLNNEVFMKTFLSNVRNYIDKYGGEINQLIETYSDPLSSNIRKTQRTLHHTDTVTSICFSSDSSLLISGSFDKLIRVWNLKTFSEGPETVLSGHDNAILNLAITSDNSYIISCSVDKTVRVWDLKNRILTHKISNSEDDNCVGIAISPDSKYLAIAYVKNAIEVWNFAEKECLFSLKGHFRPVISMVFDSESYVLVTGSADSTIKVWDIEKKAEEFSLNNHENWVYSVDISEHRKFIVSGSYDLTVRVWSFEDRKAIMTFNYEDPYFITSVSFSSDSKYVVSGGWDCNLKIWNLDTGKEEYTIVGHDNWIYSAKFDKKNNFIASSSWDKTVKIWDIREKIEIRNLLDEIRKISVATVSGDKRLLAHNSKKNEVLVWNLREKKQLFSLKGHEYPIKGINISGNNKFIASLDENKELIVWSVDLQKKLFSMQNFRV